MAKSVRRRTSASVPMLWTWTASGGKAAKAASKVSRCFCWPSCTMRGVLKSMRAPASFASCQAFSYASAVMAWWSYESPPNRMPSAPAASAALTCASVATATRKVAFLGTGRSLLSLNCGSGRCSRASISARRNSSSASTALRRASLISLIGTMTSPSMSQQSEVIS